MDNDEFFNTRLPARNQSDIVDPTFQFRDLIVCAQMVFSF